MYAAHHIVPVLPLKDLVDKQGNPVTPHELMTGEKAKICHLRTLFCPAIVKKHTAQYKGKHLNMRHQPQKGFRGIFVGIPDNQQGCYEVYIPATHQTIPSHDVVFDESFFSALSFTS